VPGNSPPIRRRDGRRPLCPRGGGLNADGWPDLAAVDSDDNTVALFLGGCKSPQSPPRARREREATVTCIGATAVSSRPVFAAQVGTFQVRARADNVSSDGFKTTFQ
jgi:hypothetical protein